MSGQPLQRAPGARRADRRLLNADRFPDMPASLEFLRGVLGVLCVFFGLMAGRSAGAVRQGRQKLSRLYGWVIRTVLCAAILVFRHEIDGIALGVWGLTAAAFAFGMWDVTRPRKQEDLTHEIFPE